MTNRTKEIVLAAMILLVWFSIIYVVHDGNMTGKAISNENQISYENDSNQNNNPLENPESPPNLTIQSDENKTEKNFSSKSKSGGGGGGGGGSSGENNPQEENPANNSTPNNNSSSNNHKKKIKNFPTGFYLEINGSQISLDDSFGGKKRFKFGKGNRIISEFDLNFSSDVDLSSIIADIDFSSGKSFMHSNSGILQNISLYVPIKPEDNAIIICSNASSFEQIYKGCSNNSLITKEETINITSPRITLSSDGLYYIITGITGTGAVGANVTEIKTETGNVSAAESINATAGNVTELILFSDTTTQSWQGYFGNASGTIQLADGNNKVMYNWTSLDFSGQVYASTNNTIFWNYIQCFNFSSTGTHQDDSSQAGATSRYGTNLSQLESLFGIISNDNDGVDETFSLFGSGSHRQFYASHYLFSEGKCPNTRIFTEKGMQEIGKFEEVLMYEPTSTSVVFASLLNDDILGFDNRTHDFESMVLENGHGTNQETTTYYFFVEVT